MRLWGDILDLNQNICEHRKSEFTSVQGHAFPTHILDCDIFPVFACFLACPLDALTRLHTVEALDCEGTAVSLRRAPCDTSTVPHNPVWETLQLTIILC